MQPPSGGCVLKHYKIDCDKLDELAATFGWLCVETYTRSGQGSAERAATFGWLCVETFSF